MSETKEEKIKEPKSFLVLRILGFSFLVAGIVLIVLGAAVFPFKYFEKYIFCVNIT